MSELCPGNSFRDFPVNQTIETIILLDDPEAPVAFFGNGTHHSARHRAYGSKSAILKPRNPAKRRDPDSAAIVLKEGPHGVIRQSIIVYLASIVYLAWRRRLSRARPRAASLAVNRDLPVLPPVQAITSPEPNAAVLGRQDREDSGIRPTPLKRNCGNGKVAKAVEAVLGAYPNIAFTVLKETPDEIA